MFAGISMKHSEMTEAIIVAHRHFIIHREPQVALDHLLRALLEATGSDHGFIGEVSSAANNQPGLTIHSRVEGSEEKAALGRRPEMARPHRAVAIKNKLISSVLTSGQPVICNDPQPDLLQEVMPPPHSPLISFIGIPLIVAGEVVGMIGLARKTRCYTSKLMLASQPLLETCTTLLTALRSSRHNELHRDHVLNKTDMFRTIFDHTLQFIGLMTPDGILLEANKSSLQLAKLSEKDVLNKPFWQAPWWQHSAELQKKLKAAVKEAAQGKLVRFEATHPDETGNLHYVDFSLKPIKDEDGKVIYLIPEGRDITAIKHAELEGKKNAARFKAIVDTAFDGIVTINEAGNIEDFNPAAEKIFGYQATEVLGQNFGMLLPEPFRKELASNLQDYLQTGKAKVIGTIKEVAGLGKNGNTFPLEFSLSEVSIPGKRIFPAITRDISKRKKAEELLRENEQFVSDILNSAPFAVAVLDHSGTIIAVNDEWSHFATANNGMVEDTGISVNYLDICRRAHTRGQTEAGKVMEGIKAIMASTLAHFELEYDCHSPEEKRWFLMQAAPLKSRQGSVIVSHLNITSRKEAEDKIRKSEASLEEAQRIAHLGNWDWDIVSNELHWSDEIYRIFGLQPQEFQGTYEAFVAAVHTDDRHTVTDAVNQALDGGDRYDLVHRIVRPDHTERMVHEQGEVFFDHSDQPIRMLGTVRDVTQEKLAEQALQQYSEKLERLVEERTAEYVKQKIKAEQANLIKSEFLANITHELKTPLNAIIGFAEILQQEMLGPLNEEQGELINDIVDSGRDLNQMVSMILQVAHLQQESTEIHQHIFYPAKMLASVVENFKKKVIAKGQQIELKVSEEIVEIKGDEVKIREVVTALVSNAVKFSPSGGKIRVIAKKSNGQLEVCVTDSGPGIVKEDQERLFAPFTQLDSSFTKKYGGTGMGLYLAKSLVEMHGGTIWLESVVGEGSTFCFSLPHSPVAEQ